MNEKKRERVGAMGTGSQTEDKRGEGEGGAAEASVAIARGAVIDGLRASKARRWPGDAGKPRPTEHDVEVLRVDR